MAGMREAAVILAVRRGVLHAYFMSCLPTAQSSSYADHNSGFWRSAR